MQNHLRNESHPVYRLGIALLGKGATNHLHRPEVVEALKAKGISVCFLVREDYFPLLQRMDGCHYTKLRIESRKDKVAWILGYLRYLRSLYPAKDIARRHRFKVQNRIRKGVCSKFFHALSFFLARYRSVMKLTVFIEGLFHRSIRIEGIDPSELDQLLLLGIGSAGSELEGMLTWWARRNNISVVHAVGNYDHLSSKGFRGVPVDKLLVWGPSMKEDAVHLQGIPRERVRMIGAVRYSRIDQMIRHDRETFFRSRGLDPERRTILFAGSLFEFHYFEMLETYRQLCKEDDRYQLIIRVYPNKILMTSPYIRPLLEYAKTLPYVYTSLGDPYFREGEAEDEREVLQIEEEELWHCLKYSDVVINLFSTIALEACIFDKPVINMWYFPVERRLTILNPVYVDPSFLIHNRKLASYGAMRKVSSRKELIATVKEVLKHPGRFVHERRMTVQQECGTLDGGAPRRLAEACFEAFTLHKRALREVSEEKCVIYPTGFKQRNREATWTSRKF